MQSDDIFVKESSIEGKGIFAKRNFRKGEIVLQWDVSHTLPKEVVDKMSDEETRYVSFFDGVYVIMQEPEKYINHSCDANTVVKNFCDVAVRDIAADEEITTAYSEELFSETYMECNCGSKNCKKIIKC